MQEDLAFIDVLVAFGQFWADAAGEPRLAVFFLVVNANVHHGLSHFLLHRDQNFAPGMTDANPRITDIT